MQKIKISMVLLFILFIYGCGAKSDPAIDGLANCLADNNVKEYGAFWCPNCAKQSKMFGSADAILIERGVYVECDPRCDVPEEDLPIACRGVVGQTKLCLEKGIDKYPTWEFPDGQIVLGVQDLSVLATKSGCVFNEA